MASREEGYREGADPSWDRVLDPTEGGQSRVHEAALRSASEVVYHGGILVSLGGKVPFSCGEVVADGKEEAHVALVEKGHLEIYQGGEGGMVRHRGACRDDVEETVHFLEVFLGNAEGTDLARDEVVTDPRHLGDEEEIVLPLLVCQVEICLLGEETENCPGVYQGIEVAAVQHPEACPRMETDCYLGETVLLPELCQGLAVALVVHWVQRQEGLQRD